MKINNTLVRTLMLVLLGGVLLAGVWLLFMYLSYKNVQFSLSPNVTSYDLYDTQKDDFTKIGERKLLQGKGEGAVRLKPGWYYVVPAGNTISNDPIHTEITNETTQIELNPYRSKTYLNETFAPEIPSITQRIRETYPSPSMTYDIGPGQFYHFGEWFITTLHNNNPVGRDGIDVYGVILKKTDTSWGIVGSPRLVFSYGDNSTIPKDIIDATNKMIVAIP